MEIDTKQSKGPDSSLDSGQEISGPQIDTKKLFLGIQRHPFVILLSIFLMGLAGLYLSHLLENTYQAESILIYLPQENQSPEKIGEDFTINSMPLATTLEMITQPSNFETLKNLLGLDLEPAKIKGLIFVPKPRNNSNFIRVIAKTENPHLSVNLANTLANLAVKSSQEFTKKQIKAAIESYNAQLKRIQITAQEENEKLETFKKKNQYFDMKPEDSTFINQVESLKKLRDRTYLEYKSLLTQYTNIQKQIQELPEYVPAPSEKNDNPINLKIANLEALLSESKAKYTKNNPKLLLLEQELDSLLEKKKDRLDQNSSGSYVKNDLREKLQLESVHLEGKAKSAQKIYNNLNKKIKNLKDKLHEFPEKQVELVKLLQTTEITQERLKAAHKEVDAAELMMNHPKGDLELYELAKSAKPWANQMVVESLPVIALIFGAGLGCLFSMLLELKDSRLCTLKQLELSYGLPAICAVPELRRLNKKTVGTKCLFFTRIIAEYIEGCFKNVSGPLTVAFTSSLKGEGKTLFSNLTASYFSRFRKVLLLEMGGNTHPFFDTEPAERKTLSHYLKNEAELEEVIISENYDRMTLQNADPEMKELLKSERAKTLWDTLKKKYSLIIIDTPGLIEEDYAQNLVALADLNIMIIGSSSTKKSAVDESLKILENTSSKPCALLLNRVNPAYISDLRVKREMNRRKLFGRMKAWISR